MLNFLAVILIFVDVATVVAVSVVALCEILLLVLSFCGKGFVGLVLSVSVPADLFELVEVFASDPPVDLKNVGVSLSFRDDCVLHVPSWQ